MDPVAVVEASRADDPTLAASLGEAFVDDPAWAWMYPERERARRLSMMFDALLGATRRSGATILTDEARRGTAIWQRSERRDLGARGNLAVVFAMVRGRAHLRRGQALARHLAAHHPREAHWYLTTLGTDPAHQGTGVGSALVRHRLDAVDRDGAAAYLEVLVEANLAFYARFGFEVTGQFDVPDGGPHVWTMWRDARAPTA